MVDVVLVSRLIGLTGLGALVAALALVATATTLRFADRRPGHRLGALLALAAGVNVGTLILATESVPFERAAVLGMVGVVTLALLWRNRCVAAGMFLAGSALPWTVLWGAYVIILVTQPADFEPIATWTFFIVGLAVTVPGVGLALTGDPLPAEPRTSAPAGQPGSRRVGSVARVVLAPEGVGPLPASEIASFVAVVATIVAVGAVGLPGVVEPVSQVVAGALVGNEVRIIARPARARRAFEALSWLGERELERAEALTGRSVPTTKWGVRRWLAAVPDRPETRWIRVEMLLLLERFDEARAVAEKMPDGSPYERFERAYSLDMVDWMSGGAGDPPAVGAAVAALDPSDVDSSLRADVAMAVRETRLLAAENGPESATGPLLAARDRLGERADGQLRRALWRRFLPASAVSAAILVLASFAFG